MATSIVAIANLALQKLGQDAIEALDQDDPNARSMNRIYEPARDAMLRRYAWGFSIRRQSIAADGAQTAWGEHNRYSVPNDYIRLVRDDESGFRPDWRIESGDEGEGVFIVSDDDSPLLIRYIAKVEDPNAFDALFVEALACKMAHDTCKQITGSSDLKERIKEDWDQAISEAKRAGSIEKETQDYTENDDSWLNVRM